MRRLGPMLAVVLVAAVVPVVADGAGAGPPSTPRNDQRATLEALTAPLPDRPGPGTIHPDLAAAVAGLAVGTPVPVVVSLERPATGTFRRVLDRLASGSWFGEHAPVAVLRLPAGRLVDVAALDGVHGLYPAKRLTYFLDESADLMNLPEAWGDLGVTGKGVNIAIVDTGIDFTHPDLADAEVANVKLAYGGDPLPTVVLDGLPNSDTSSGHGTHVAGDAAGRGTASDGKYRGPAYEAGLIGVSSGDALLVPFAIQGLDWVLDKQAELDISVVNNSWGTGFAPFDPYDPVNLTTRELARRGVVVVFANGNDGDEMSMNPYAAAPWVVPVAAGTKAGKVTDFSSGGIEADTVGRGFSRFEALGETRQPLAMGLYHPAVTSPGENIVAPRANNTIIPPTAAPNDLNGDLEPTEVPYYTTLSGTSMASPETAGVVALVREAGPELDPAQVRMALQVTARPLAGIPFHVGGYGYTDAAAAVKLAQGLHGQGPEAIQAELERLQAARDRQVLAGLAHPSFSYARETPAPSVGGTISHRIPVPEGTTRFKVVTNRGTAPVVGGGGLEITVADAAGTLLGSAAAESPSGSTVLDLDLSEAPDAAFGNWEVTLTVSDGLLLPYPSAADTAKRTIDTLISVFPRKEGACSAFVPGEGLGLRLQDDTSPGVPFPSDPDTTYIGPVRGGSLADRTPARRLAGGFGQMSTTVLPLRFTTAPMHQSVTLGGPAALDLWVEGPDVGGRVVATLVDIPPGDTTAIPIAQGPADAIVAANPDHPVLTEVPLSLFGPATIAAGHRLGLDLAMTFVATSGNTLFFDSDEFPSGLRLTTGQVAKDCPGS